MKYIIFVAALSGCGGNAVCDPAVLCPGRTNASYAFCNAGSEGCYFVGSDGSRFACRSCGDCTSAQQLAIGWCATAPANPTGETCQAAACSNGKTYQYCTSGDGKQCRYTTSDAKTFSCNGCTDCTGAASQLTSWCGTSTAACSSQTTTAQCYNCCRIANPAGEAYIRNNVFPCVCNACSFECAGTAFCGGPDTATVSSACSTCYSSALQGSCGAWINACMTDTGCSAYYTCVTNSCTRSP